MIPIMPAFLAPVAALLISMFVMQTGASLTNTLIPLRGYAEAFPTPLIGAMGTAYFGGFVIGCFAVPMAVRRVGYIRTFASIAAIAAVSIMLMPVFTNPMVWIGLRVLNGAAASGLYAVIEAWLNDKTDKTHRGSTFSIYQVLMFCGSLGGQNLLGLADITAPDLFIYASALIILALIPVSMTTRQSPTPPTKIKLDLKWAATLSPIAVFGIICVGFANGSTWGLAPVFMSSQGFSAQQTGWFMMAFLLGGACGQFPVGRLSDRLDRRWTIMGVAATSSIFGLVLSFEYGGAFLTLAVTMFCFGFVSLTIYSLCVAHINDLCGPERRMEIATAMLLFYSVGASIGPLITSTLIDLSSFATLYRVTAATHGALALFAAWRMIRRPRKLGDDRPAFVVTMPRTAPLVSPLDPMARSDNTSRNPRESVQNTDQSI